MVIKAYILISTDTKFTKTITQLIAVIEGVNEVNEVLGPFDIVVEIQMDTLEQISECLRDKIRGIEGVKDTVTCVRIR